jgi:hypothetical protein
VYLLQRREKMKARGYYGVLDGMFRNYYEEATRQTGLTGENLLRLLEMRLDNVVYRGGLARSRDEVKTGGQHGVMPAKRLANPPLPPIPHDGGSHLARHRHSQTRVVQLVAAAANYEHLVRRIDPLAMDTVEIALLANSPARRKPLVAHRSIRSAEGRISNHPLCVLRVSAVFLTLAKNLTGGSKMPRLCGMRQRCQAGKI